MKSKWHHHLHVRDLNRSWHRAFAKEPETIAAAAPVDQAKLVAACRKLVALVDAPEPGLAVWHVMCADTVDELRRLLGGSE